MHWKIKTYICSLFSYGGGATHGGAQGIFLHQINPARRGRTYGMPGKESGSAAYKAKTLLVVLSL